MPLQEIFIHSGDVARVGSDSQFGGRRSVHILLNLGSVTKNMLKLNNSKVPSRIFMIHLYFSPSWDEHFHEINFCWFRDFVTLPEANSLPVEIGRAPKTSFPTHHLFGGAMSVSSGGYVDAYFVGTLGLENPI